MDVFACDRYMPSWTAVLQDFNWHPQFQCVHVDYIGLLFVGDGMIPDEWF